MPLEPGPHAEILEEALALEADAQRAALAGDRAGAAAGFRAAADRYRASWESAPPRSFGRLVGMLKAAIQAGDAAADAAYARDALGGTADSPASAYALAVADLVLGDDAGAAAAAAGMHGGSEAFDRTAAAITALATGDGPAYAAALAEIVRSFETRDEHLTGVAIADTAVMLEALAEPRGLAAHPAASPVLPPA
ncbi:MAG: hypothetical protein MUC84_06390 [Solirubrobacteraceae bacterium]|jgi:hypothetical protein|nr:hypothetical protein [Solirubrobacteraceae bacterium]